MVNGEKKCFSRASLLENRMVDGKVAAHQYTGICSTNSITLPLYNLKNSIRRFHLLFLPQVELLTFQHGWYISVEAII